MNRPDCSISRRTMLGRCAQWGALAWAGGHLQGFAATSRRWFKIGACEWSLGKSDPSCFELAKKIGLDGVQVNLGSLGNEMQLLRPDVQKAYLEAARRTGMGIGSLAIGEMNNVPLKSDPRAARWLAESIDVCQAMKIPIVMPACFYKGDLDLNRTEEIDRLVGVLKDVAPKAEKAGVAIGLESYLSAKDTMTIIQRVGSPVMKMYYDVGNSTDKGYDIYREIPMLGKLICEFHFKDAGHLLGKGRIDFKRVRKALDQIEYSGWIQLESAAPNGIAKDYAAQCQFLRTLFPEGSAAKRG